IQCPNSSHSTRIVSRTVVLPLPLLPWRSNRWWASSGSGPPPSGMSHHNTLTPCRWRRRTYIACPSPPHRLLRLQRMALEELPPQVIRVGRLHRGDQRQRERLARPKVFAPVNADQHHLAASLARPRLPQHARLAAVGGLERLLLRLVRAARRF